MKKLFRVAANDSHETSTDDHRDGSLTLGQIPIYLPSNALHGPYCLSHNFTWLTKLYGSRKAKQSLRSLFQ